MIRPSPRALLVVVALPLLLLLERLAWYGTRTISFPYLQELGWTSVDVGVFHGVQNAVLPLVTVLSGLLALAVGPLPMIALGLLFAATGYAMVPMFDPSGVEVPLYLTVVGTALFRPAIWAALLIPLARPRESGRIGACILLYGVSNAGAVAASPGASWLMSQFGSETVYTVAAALAGLGFLGSLAVAGGWVGTAAEEAAAPPGPSRRLEWPVVLAVAGLGVVLFIPWAGLMTGFEAVYSTLWELDFVAGHESIWTAMNPAIVIFLALLLASIFLMLTMLEKTVPALLLAGGGMVILAVGLIAVAIGPIRESPWGFGAAFALVSVGEVLAAPALISRIGGDVHWRLTTLFVALWLATSQLGYAASGVLRGSGLMENPFGLPLAFAIMAIPLGLVLLVVAIPLQRRLFDPPPSARKPAPGPVVAPPQF